MRAEMSGFSKSYFITTFKKMMGETPYMHISKLRLSKAKVFLQNTDLPIYKIAELCGFPRPNAFTNLFKSETGRTPKEYRRLSHRKY